VQVVKENQGEIKTHRWNSIFRTPFIEQLGNDYVLTIASACTQTSFMHMLYWLISMRSSKHCTQYWLISILSSKHGTQYWLISILSSKHGTQYWLISMRARKLSTQYSILVDHHALKKAQYTTLASASSQESLVHNAVLVDKYSLK
jgi:hypothetical protein